MTTFCIRLSTRKEALTRDIERLSLERAEMSENCTKMRERETEIRHQLDLEEMGFERIRLDDVSVEQRKLMDHVNYNTVLIYWKVSVLLFLFLISKFEPCSMKKVTR